MRICFCLPHLGRKPSGGFKIVFEYANRLIERGHEVTIAFNYENLLKINKLPDFVKMCICNYVVTKGPTWFPLNNKVKKLAINGIDNNTIPNGDIIVATAIETSEDVFKLAPCKGKKVYFIQGFENWEHKDEEVYGSYRLNMKKIVISRWLKKIVDLNSEIPSVYIPNGLDFNVFGVDIPIRERNPYSIAMLYHNSEIKGSKYGLEAIYRLKQLFPEIIVRVFGVPKRPEGLPNWINYTRKATHEQLRDIYNNSAIFLSPSINEGFGLTGAESMACGCALVSTSYPAVFEYAEHNENSLISPIKDVDALVNNIIKLFSDNELRMRLAYEGKNGVKKLSWENSSELFEDTLNKILCE